MKPMDRKKHFLPILDQAEQKVELRGSKTAPEPLKFKQLVDYIYLNGKMNYFQQMYFLNNPNVPCTVA